MRWRCRSQRTACALEQDRRGARRGPGLQIDKAACDGQAVHGAAEIDRQRAAGRDDCGVEGAALEDFSLAAIERRAVDGAGDVEDAARQHLQAGRGLAGGGEIEFAVDDDVGGL